MGFGATLRSLYSAASSTARSAFNAAARTTQGAVDALEHGYKYAENATKEAYNTGRQATKDAYGWVQDEAGKAYDYGKDRAIHGYDFGKQKVDQAYAYGKHKSDQAYDYTKTAAKSAQNYITNKYDGAKKSVKQKVDEAKNAADQLLNSQPAGAPIQECPFKSKADRVKARKDKISNANNKLHSLPDGPAKTTLAHSAQRLERTNYAVERLRLANDTYTVDKVDSSGKRPPPPEGWERLGKDEVAKLGVNTRLFPQFRPGFRPDEYSDGFYPEVYKSKQSVFGEEVYVLALRGTQGKVDWVEGNAKQAFGMQSEHYEQAKNIGRNLKEALDSKHLKLETTGDSLAGGMAAAVAITSQVPGFTSDTAGVHPDTLGTFSRSDAEKLVQNYYTKGEILTTVQNPTVQRTLMVGLANVGGLPTIAGMGLAGHRAISDQGTLTFGAAGPMYEVPALANADEVADAATKGKAAQGMASGLAGRLNNDFNPLKKVAMHKDMKYVIAGIEQQKADDLAVIDRALAK